MNKALFLVHTLGLGLLAAGLNSVVVFIFLLVVIVARLENLNDMLAGIISITSLTTYYAIPSVIGVLVLGAFIKIFLPKDESRSEIAGVGTGAVIGGLVAVLGYAILSAVSPFGKMATAASGNFGRDFVFMLVWLVILNGLLGLHLIRKLVAHQFDGSVLVQGTVWKRVEFYQPWFWVIFCACSSFLFYWLAIQWQSEWLTLLNLRRRLAASA